jgi:hypothetical protein
MPTRLTFSLDPDDAAMLAQLSARYLLPMAAIVRESVRRLLADPAYEQRLQAELLARHPLPTAQQQAAFERDREALMAVDLAAICASMPTPPDATDL